MGDYAQRSASFCHQYASSGAGAGVTDWKETRLRWRGEPDLNATPSRN